ncbi:EAL domain-containing protein [Anaerobacillus alkaliphilus]|uniref:EAL domain-containing protein n=1 Tax=Anaerobacillus alkaliphilus TaxID=1548597 RepID=A0A4Q0VL68_9BACI|nr:EAL domain-containing protein [Anaerobacillus alkaliphilus]RXI96217.1 EAL domain-containing protein [Anaerobacillus alkaliphilus]
MLTTNRRLILLLFTAIIFLYYGWSFLFSEEAFRRSIGASIFSMVTGMITLVLLLNVVKKSSSGSKRNFWLLLGTGVFLNIIGNVIFLFSIINQGFVSVYDFSFLLWLGAYIFYLMALVQKTKSLSNSTANSPFTFNIIVFMTVSVTISIHFLITPIWLLSENSFFLTMIGLFYTITDLSILFLITYLYYLSKSSKERPMIVLLIFGFIFQITGDSAFLYLTLREAYQHGGAIEPIWLLGLMFIGLAALFSEETSVENSLNNSTYLDNSETVFPYISVIILMVLGIHSYHYEFNALSIGMLLIFIMIVSRQFVIIRKNKILMDEYKYLAYHDSLTGLNNRASFNEQLIHYMDEAKQAQSSVGLLLIDLDRFKLVNDTLGHHIGDRLLEIAAQRLQYVLNEDDVLYRIGGDEFVVISPNATEENCIEISETIIKEFRASFIVDHHDISISPSIGISLYPRNAEESQQLLKNADFAMYLAKGNGRNSYCFFHSDLNDALTRKVKIENELRRAIERNQLVLYYQPIVDLKTGQPTGVEALVRWFHPEMGSISPAEFIPIAEETGQIIPIGDWVLETACKQNLAWQKEGLPPVTISVNVSVRQFQHTDFIAKVKNVLETTGHKPALLELEITESIMQNVNESINILKQLKDIGVKTAIDDFGTGYSSLHILKKLPIDTIKVDKLFIDDITDEANQPIVKTIIDIGANLNLRVIAEGIETIEQANILTQYQCHFGQGYLYSKPVPAEMVPGTFRGQIK